jgi:glycine/D-amino acid oxidase-like deaminating enzyme/nitrite reductase/ring-hydroxylating ferredoxin subunit
MMKTSSPWTESADLPAFPVLDRNVEADVVVAGAGIAGLTAALILQRAGKSVVVIEARRIGGGETGLTTAHLTEVLDTRYHVLESKFGREGARIAAESSRAAIDRIEAALGESGTRCGFERVPAYLFAETEEQRNDLESELESLQQAGIDAAWVDSFPLPIRVLGAIRVERQGQLHPLEYSRELALRFISAGGRIFEETRLQKVDDGEPCRVSTNRGEIAAKNALVLTNVPVSNRFALHTKVAAYRSYALAARLQEPISPGLFWDMRDPYHYVRQQTTASGPLLIVGGEDHKTGQNTDPLRAFDRLRKYTATHFGIAEVVYRWSGQIVEPVDGLPFIGKNSGSEHVYVATGFSGNGMTFGTLAGMILSDGVLGVYNPWASLYDATRVKPLAQARQYVAENVDFPARLARDRLARGEAESAEGVAPGEGRLIRSHGKMLAVYRDDSGALHARSAVCTHLGCHVQWNKAEKSWDCPCHGSRFDVDGMVLNGPATRSLEEASLETASHEPKRRHA